MSISKLFLFSCSLALLAGSTRVVHSATTGDEPLTTKFFRYRRPGCALEESRADRQFFVTRGDINEGGRPRESLLHFEVGEPLGSARKLIVTLFKRIDGPELIGRCMPEAFCYYPISLIIAEYLAFSTYYYIIHEERIWDMPIQDSQHISCIENITFNPKDHTFREHRTDLSKNSSISRPLPSERYSQFNRGTPLTGKTPFAKITTFNYGLSFSEYTNALKATSRKLDEEITQMPPRLHQIITYNK